MEGAYLFSEGEHLGLEALDFGLQFDDVTHAGQVDALVLGEVLHEAQLLYIAHCVSSSLARGPCGDDKTEAIVGAQGLGMHSSQMGGGGDEEKGRIQINAGDGRTSSFSSTHPGLGRACARHCIRRGGLGLFSWSSEVPHDDTHIPVQSPSRGSPS